MPLKTNARDARILQHNLDGTAEDVTPKKKRDNEEEREQALVFLKCDALKAKYPALEWMFATLNGVFLPPAILKRVADSGLTKGILDIWLIWPMVDSDGQHWNGVVIDMKTAKGRPTPEQMAWAEHLKNCRFRVYFCGGVKTLLSPSEDALACIYIYLGIIGESLNSK